MIELTSPAEVIALKLEWEKRHGQCYTTPQEYKAKISRGGQRYYVRGPGEYKEEVKVARERIHANYKASEDKRKILRPPKVTAKKREEDERWDRIWKEKFEDKSYYAR